LTILNNYDIINSKTKAEELEMKSLTPIRLTTAEREYAQRIVNDKVTAETFKKRAQVFLALDANVGEPETHEKIGKRIGVSRQAIWTMVKAFHGEGIEESLKFKTPAEPNKKPIVTGEIEARIIAVACGEPPAGYGRWTVRSLTNKIEMDILPGISRETVRLTLKKLNLNLT